MASQYGSAVCTECICLHNVCGLLYHENRAMGVLLKHVASEARTQELKSQMRKVGSAFLTHREVSAQEAVYRLSLQMKQLSSIH